MTSPLRLQLPLLPAMAMVDGPRGKAPPANGPAFAGLASRVKIQIERLLPPGGAGVTAPLRNRTEIASRDSCQGPRPL